MGAAAKLRRAAPAASAAGARDQAIGRYVAAAVVVALTLTFMGLGHSANGNSNGLSSFHAGFGPGMAGDSAISIHDDAGHHDLDDDATDLFDGVDAVNVVDATEHVHASEEVIPLPYQHLRDKTNQLPPEEVEDLHDDSDAPIDLADAVSREKFTIIVLAHRRYGSLQRLLNSLKAADYLGDKVALEIQIDGSSGSLWKRTISVANKFQWPFGSKKVTVGQKHLGLAHAWLTAWSPTSNSDYCVILEDDLTVSPMFYKWLHVMWTAYGDRPEIGGISLQRQHIRATDGAANVIDSTKPFAYKLFGTWGFSPSPRYWRKFLNLEFKKVNPEVPGLVTSEWFKAKKKGTVWNQYWIWFCEQNSLYTLHWNAPDGKAMATNWRQRGQLPSEEDSTPDDPIFGAADWSTTLERPAKFITTYGWDAQPDGKSSPPEPSPPPTRNSDSVGVTQESTPPTGVGPAKTQTNGSPSTESAEILSEMTAEERDRMAHTNLTATKRDFSALIMAAQKTTHGRFLYLQLLNVGFLKFTRSWICNVRNMPNVLVRTLFVCTDQAAYDGLKSFGEANGIQLNLHLELYETQAVLTYGHFDYYMFMLFRASLMLALVESNVSYILTESDATWFRDVNDYLETKVDPNIDLLTLNDDFRYKTSLNGGFLWFKPTPTTVDLLRHVNSELSATLAKFKVNAIVGQAGNEQFMFQEYIKSRRKSSNPVNIAYLDAERFSPGQWYRMPYRTRGLAPYVVLNNWLKGMDVKITRAASWGQWFLQSDDVTCKVVDAPKVFTAGDLVVSIARMDEVLKLAAGLEQSTVMLLVVDNAYVQQALNWLCGVRKIQSVLNRLLVVCKDEASLTALRAFQGVSGIEFALTSLIQQRFGARILLTTTIMHRLLREGLDVLVVRPSATWFDDPVPALQAASQERHIVSLAYPSNDYRKPSEQLMLVKHSATTIELVNRAIIYGKKQYIFKYKLTMPGAFEAAIRSLETDPDIDMPVDVELLPVMVAPTTGKLSRPAGASLPILVWRKDGISSSANTLTSDKTMCKQ